MRPRRKDSVGHRQGPVSSNDTGATARKHPGTGSSPNGAAGGTGDAHALAAIAETRKVQEDPATGPPRVPMGLATNPVLPGGNSVLSLPLLLRNAAKYGDPGPVRHVFVKATMGRTMTVRVHSWHDPISAIEAHMRCKQGTPAGLHRLVFAGKTLTHSHWTLAQYGIGEGSTLDVLGRLRGGMPAQREASGQTNGDDNMDTTEAPQP